MTTPQTLVGPFILKELHMSELLVSLAVGAFVADILFGRVAYNLGRKTARLIVNCVSASKDSHQ